MAHPPDVHEAPDPVRAPLHALVLADGDRPPRAGLDAAWPGWDRHVGLVVAADGGARLAADLGLTPDRWVGDGDSVDPAQLAELESRGVVVIRADRDKDESDGELALIEAVRGGATGITVLGALGGRRLDHLLANIGLLLHPALAGIPTRLLDEATRVTVVDASATSAGSSVVRRELGGRVGDLVSLLPVGGDVAGVVTSGLRYPLRDEPLLAGPARGLSNVRDRADAWIDVRGGRLLVVESPATLGP
jgi:thiamine pyrophosphokinase